MPTYRIFFREGDGTLVGRDEFDAPDDLRAMVVARMLCDACSDRAASCELRQGFRLIDRRFPMRTVNLHWEHLASRTQEIVYERQIALLESRWAIADSARLLQQTQRLLNQTRRAAQPLADRARWQRDRVGSRSRGPAGTQAAQNPGASEPKTEQHERRQQRDDGNMLGASEFDR